ncbi:unnamed protein product [Bursaphelenchus xylophilus]|uniref:(pine wood nematode) hypothetical protein n=1 Tax=Bursaphelenchus xylophilus TaxID=6326 RepID=A0A1I7S846_BURXY|nr:unnamed protein product [Bursaphelenchus xylophilus]CAG9080583.1 unnamed protein product [Bursaphelenchus xylophilus]
MARHRRRRAGLRNFRESPVQQLWPTARSAASSTKCPHFPHFHSLSTVAAECQDSQSRSVRTRVGVKCRYCGRGFTAYYCIHCEMKGITNCYWIQNLIHSGWIWNGAWVSGWPRPGAGKGLPAQPDCHR